MLCTERFHSSGQYILTYLVRFNVYTEAHEDPPEVRRNQILSTRLFLALISIAMVGYTGYASLIQQASRIETINPSQADYERLEAMHSSTLVCLCSQLSISPGSFLDVSVAFHQVWIVQQISLANKDNPNAPIQKI